MRTEPDVPLGRMAPNELRSYWSRLSERHLSKDPQGFAVICCAGMPPWLNRFLDKYQRLAFARLLRGVDLRGARVLDLGTGVGRWAQWFSDRGAARVVGVDLEQQRLELARYRSSERAIDFQRMSVDRLAFPAEAFDIVNSVTVLQHVDRTTKERAMAEIARVLRPGGHAVLFELTDMLDDAPHVFPETRSAWCALGRCHGLSVVRMLGEQYIPLLRFAKLAMRRFAGASSRQWIDAFKDAGPDRPIVSPSTLGLRLLVLLSYPVETLCQQLLPPGAAKITGFLFKKDASASVGPAETEPARCD